MRSEQSSSSKLESSPRHHQLLLRGSRRPPSPLPPHGCRQNVPHWRPTYDRPTRRPRSLSAHSSSTFRSLSPPVLSSAYVVDQPVTGLHRTGRTASSQRVVSPHARSQRAPSLSPSQSTFSYGAPSPAVGSDIEVEYPAARPFVFQPMPPGASADVDTAAIVDRARPAAAGVGVSVDVGRMSAVC